MNLETPVEKAIQYHIELLHGRCSPGGRIYGICHKGTGFGFA